MHKFLISVIITTVVFWYAFLTVLLERSPDNAFIVAYALILLFGVITLTLSLIIFGVRKVSYLREVKDGTQTVKDKDIDWKKEYRKGLWLGCYIALFICFILGFRMLTIN